MVNFKDFTKDGNTDWDAYQKAQVDTGERCSNCGRYLVFSNGKKSLCSSCKDLTESKNSVSHDSFIRCPKCNTSFEALDLIEFDIYEEGEHDIDCPSCGYFFVIETTVSFSFDSPAIVDIYEDENTD